MNKKLPSRLLNAGLGLVLAGLTASSGFAETTEYPPLKLRGYGTLAGTLTSVDLDGQPASILKITCADDTKAQLLQAKYLSDLRVLPGITPGSIPGVAGAAAYQFADQGALLAARDGAIVYLLWAPTLQALGRLESTNFAPGHGPFSFTAATPVPMYLDRWDKYGFRFYYGPFTKPTTPDRKSDPDYDPTQDFTYAQQSDHAGMLFWNGGLSVDPAEGILDNSSWKWALLEAQKLGLPVGINMGHERFSWILNRYPEQMLQYHPQFLGSYYGSMNYGIGEILSWNALAGKDLVLSNLQESVRLLRGYENVTSWLEPHGEMGGGVADLLVDYGPVADQGYRRYLQEQYRSVQAVSRRWFGHDTAFKSWDDIRVPELASFAGWGPDALDLTGTWRISYDAPYGRAAAAPALDDSSWPTLQAPGHAIVRFLERKPAVLRRHFTVDPAWRAAHPRVWIYIWDLNDTRPRPDETRTAVQVFVNGQLLPENPPRISQDHWVGLDVSQQLVDGDNQVTLTLPKGMFNYRAYLSPHEPLLYPLLGVHENARWVDFFNWNSWSRVNGVRRGTQMIRQNDPDRGIMLMAPEAYLDGIWKVAQEYGGEFHNTGSMAGSWRDSLPAFMRAAGLPMSTEPGSGAKDVPEFKKFFGLWITEGVNGIDYFMHEGDIYWRPEIKQCFDDNLRVFNSIGKYHAPQADIAALYSYWNNCLISFPWSGNVVENNTGHLGSGYDRWNVRAVLRGRYESDAVTESSFDSATAAGYRVIIDANTSIIDDHLLAGIEKYVRAGGTFVTFVQTGRHTSTVQDSWPIEKLTGYHVQALQQKKPWQTAALKFAPNQPIFSGNWIDRTKADGLSLQKIAPDVQDLAYWKADGSVAIGLRRLGQGAIIQVGCRFTEVGLPDRIDHEFWEYNHQIQRPPAGYGLPESDAHGLLTPELLATQQVFAQIAQWRGIAPVPARLEPNQEEVVVRHYISNSGLYDVWALWNANPKLTVTGNLLLDQGLQPAWRIDLRDGAKTPITANRLAIHLEPLQTTIYLTPRSKLTDAPAQWFSLQRHWWSGTSDPGPKLATLQPKLAYDLTQDWAFQPLDDQPKDVTALVAPTLDDTAWKHMTLGIFTLPDYPGVHHGIFRKRFTVPAAWTQGQVALWIQQSEGNAFLDSGKVYLDGKLLQETSSGIPGSSAGGVLTAGSSHLLALEVTGKGVNPLGVRAPAWLSYHPAPASRQDLSGNWEFSTDGLRYGAPTPLPGVWPGKTARRMVKIPATATAQTVVAHVVGDNRCLRGVIINGNYMMYSHGDPGPEHNLNITPWVKFSEPNELILVSGGSKVTLQDVSLDFYPQGIFP